MDLLGWLFFVFLVCYLILKYAGLDDKESRVVKIVRAWIVGLSLCGFGWYVFSSLSVNAAPRSAIDQSMVDQRENALDKSSHDTGGK